MDAASSSMPASVSIDVPVSGDESLARASSKADVDASSSSRGVAPASRLVALLAEIIQRPAAHCSLGSQSARETQGTPIGAGLPTHALMIEPSNESPSADDRSVDVVTI